MTETRKLTAILAADIVGYSRLAGTDEERVLARLRTLRSDLVDPTIAVHGGRVFKRTGDGILVEFHSVVDAVRCAIEIQLGMAERNAGLPPEKRIEYRVGVHIGDVVEESDGDLMGDGVNIAARLEGIAKPGRICLSEQAYWQVKGRLDLAVIDLGLTQLKNIAEPVHVYSLEAGIPAKAKLLKSAGRRQRAVIIALAALAVALAAIAAGVWHFRSAGSEGERIAVMVLPFTNLSGDPSQNQLAEAVTGGLTDAFSRLTASYSIFKVIPSDTAKAYAGKPIDVKQIGKDLGLRYVLQGSLQPTEARVRVSAQLIDAESGVQLWAETFDEDRADPLVMEDEIVARVMNAVRFGLADVEAERARRARPGSPMALALLCGARAGEYAAEAVDPEKRAELFKTCDEALRLDPHNVIALGVRAAWLLDGVDRAQSADREGDLRRAKEDIMTLLGINKSDAYANALNVNLLRLEGRPEQAIAEGERNIALNPDFVQTYFYLCPAYIDAKQAQKAIDCVDKAVRLSPHDPSLYGLLMTKAGALETLGRDAEALDWVGRSLALSPANPIALRNRAVWLLDGVDRGQSADREGDLKRAEEDVKTLLAIGLKDPWAHALNVYLLRLEGQPEQAIAEGERNIALNPDFVQTYYYLCPAYTAAGQPEKAIDCVDKAIRLSPHDPSLYGLLMTKAGSLETLGRDAEALDWVGRSLALSPANPIALRHEIVILEVLGRDDEARDAYRRYAALPGPQIRTIAELRARAMDAGASGPSPTFVEALRKAGMPEK